MSGELVPVSQLMTRTQYDALKFMYTGNGGQPMPKWDASAGNAANNPFNPRTLTNRATEQDRRTYARSQREMVFTGAAGQPVGGRAARQHKLNSSRTDNWGPAEEKAFQKAFGYSSVRGEAPRPTGTAPR